MKTPKKLYQKVKNQPKKVKNNNVNSINIILNPHEEGNVGKQLQRPSGGAGAPVIQELARITPPSLEDARQVLGRAQRLDEPIGNISDIQQAGINDEVQAALVQEAQRQQDVMEREELQNELDQRDSIMGSIAQSMIDNMSGISSNASEISSLRADTENDIDELNRALQQHQSQEMEANLQREGNMLKLEELMDEDEVAVPPQEIGALTNYLQRGYEYLDEMKRAIEQQEAANQSVNLFLTPPTADRPEPSAEVYNPIDEGLQQQLDASKARDLTLQREIEELRSQLLTPVRTPSPPGPRSTPTAPRDASRLQTRVNAATQQIPIASMNSLFARDQDAIESRLKRLRPRQTWFTRKPSTSDSNWFREADI